MPNLEVINILKKEKAKLAAEFGVEELALFGSYARGEEDILIKLKRPSLRDLIGAYNYLEKILGKKIDIVTKHQNNSPRFMNLISKELIYV